MMPREPDAVMCLARSNEPKSTEECMARQGQVPQASTPRIAYDQVNRWRNRHEKADGKPPN
jgi:hypothetical protein